MKISLIHPKSPNSSKSSLIWPPLGLCRISKYLELKNHKVKIIEDGLNNYSINTILDMVKDSDIVGIGAMTVQSGRSVLILNEIRKMCPDIKIVLGGPHFSSLAKQNIQLADATIIGDGELGFEEFINGHRGIIYSDSLKEYIPIDFKYIDYLNYGDHLIDMTRAISILTSRGCPYNCKFCGSPNLFGRSVLYYPLQEVVDNMKDLSKEYGIKSFRIMDDNFMLSSKRVEDFCLLVKDLGFTFSCLSNVKTIKKEILSTMKGVGFKFIAVGVESPNQMVLDICDKNNKIEDVTKSISLINESGLACEVLLMAGLPGETETSMKQLVDFMKNTIAYRIHLQYFTPFPGCEFYDEIQKGKYGKFIETDLNLYDHRKPVFLPDTISLDAFLELSTEAFSVINKQT